MTTENELNRDLSYSAIVSELQGDAEKGHKLIYDLAIEMDTMKLGIEEIEKALQSAKNMYGYNQSGIMNICRHLQINLPARICNDTDLITITENSVEMEDVIQLKKK